MNMENQYCHPMYFPTKIAVIDDDPDYLDYLGLLLDDRLACQYFTSPSDALDTVKASNQNNMDLARKCASPFETGEPHLQLRSYDNKNIEHLYKILNNPSRFNHFSVVIVDYSMPGMNGLELCEKLQSPYIKKILITGKADDQVAVSAFNNGLIDHFIRKEDDHIEDKINQTIHKLSHQYFEQICTIKNVALKYEAPYLFDPEFTPWFTKICSNHKITEYYLWGDLAIKGFLMLTMDGQYKILLLNTPSHTQSHLEIAHDYNAPEKLIKSIREKKIIPDFPGLGAYDERFRHNWENYVYPAKCFNEYIYTLLESDDIAEFDLDISNKTYRNFLHDFYSPVYQ